MRYLVFFRVYLTKLGFWLGCSLFFFGTVGAQISISVPGTNINIGQQATNEVNNSSGVIASDAQIEGVTIINQKVFIDGEEVPRNVTVFASKKSKITYIIKRDKSGNVSVSEK